MATFVHPVTGVVLNEISVKRNSFPLRVEGLTICLLRQNGTPYHEIAHMMGANPFRIGEVLRGEKFADTAEEARDLIGYDLFCKR